VWPPGSAETVCTVCPRQPLTVNFDRSILKLVCESHPRWETFLPNLGTLGLWVLELFAMYETDGRTDGRTKATLIAPFPTVRGTTTLFKKLVATITEQNKTMPRERKLLRQCQNFNQVIRDSNPDCRIIRQSGLESRITWLTD